MPHPELHLDGMFRVSGGHGGNISCTSIGSDFVLVASLCWFLYYTADGYNYAAF